MGEKVHLVLAASSTVRRLRTEHRISSSTPLIRSSSPVLLLRSVSRLRSMDLRFRLELSITDPNESSMKFGVSRWFTYDCSVSSEQAFCKASLHYSAANKQTYNQLHQNLGSGIQGTLKKKVNGQLNLKSTKPSNHCFLQKKHGDKLKI